MTRALLNRLAEWPAYCLPQRWAQQVAGWLFARVHAVLNPALLSSTQALVQLTLGEPRHNASRIARQCLFAKGRQRCNYRAMSRTRQWRSARHSLSPATHRILAESAEPLVLLTLHQADYLAGLLAILRLIPTERPIHIIKLAEWTQIEQDAYRHFRQYGHTLVIHRLSERPAKRIVRALKSKAILLTFVDVPREFGTTTQVQMFGLPFRLTAGPLAMARLAGAAVVPLFSNYDSAGNCEVRAGDAIRSRDVDEMAQRLALDIEANLRIYPHQWEMWPVLADLWDADALIEPAANLSPAALARLALAKASSEADAPTPNNDSK